MVGWSAARSRQGAFGHLRRHHRRRRVGAHAAGVWTLVAIERALVVLRARERQRGIAVAQDEEARLFAGEKFLDHKLGAGFAQSATEDHVDCALGLRKTLRHHHALAGGEPVGLDHDRTAVRAHVILGRIRCAETLIGGGRDAVRLAQILGEALGAFEPRGGFGRAERLDPGALEIIHDTGGERSLGSDHDEVDRARLAERDHVSVVGGIERDTLRLARDPGVAGGAIKLVHQGACRDLPGQRVFAPARAEDEDIHGRSRISGREPNGTATRAKTVTQLRALCGAPQERPAPGRAACGQARNKPQARSPAGICAQSQPAPKSASCCE